MNNKGSIKILFELADQCNESRTEAIILKLQNAIDDIMDTIENTSGISVFDWIISPEPLDKLVELYHDKEPGVSDILVCENCKNVIWPWDSGCFHCN